MLKLATGQERAVLLPYTEKVVATAMADGAGFNTQAVTWPVGRRGKWAPGRAEIRIERGRRLRWLRKHGRAHPDLAVMAEQMEICGRRRLSARCLHPACPRCAGALQRFMVRIGRDFFAAQAEKPWAILSLILPVADPDGPIDFAAERQRYERLVRNVDLTQGVFGLDLSFNEDHRRTVPAAELFAPHPCVHLFGFAPAAELEAAEAKLKQLVPATEPSPRPVRVDDYDGSLQALAYAFKPSFERRQSIEKIDPRRGKLVRNTRHRPRLKVEQQIQAVRALDRAGLTGRIILLGLRFKATNAGRLCLVPTT